MDNDKPAPRRKAVANKTVLPNGSNVFGENPSPNSSKSREDAIIDKTKRLAFPDAAVLPLENFEHGGDRPAGWQNSIADMQKLSGKDLQESYRVGAANARGMADYTEKVADR